MVCAEHQSLLAEVRSASFANVLAQPRSRGTGFAVLFGLASALERNAEVVLLTPCDHGMADPSLFRTSVLCAAMAVARGRADIVVFGATPSEPTAEFGWLSLGRTWDPRDSYLRAVTAFVEKPSPEEAASLYQSGSVWNTFVLVARPRAIVELYEQHVPALAHALRDYLEAGGTLRESLLRDVYDTFGSVDFSRDILTKAAGVAAITWPASMGWSDLGTPQSLGRWQASRCSLAS